ncbi:hypothetical protein [Kineococcus sp. SYSU DK002]|uniref:hypothetical protein n=1 Tax=Kineococcus sp. SYSU DK002 TaxID=3383123 RepID=UPI003D7DD408
MNTRHVTTATALLLPAALLTSCSLGAQAQPAPTVTVTRDAAPTGTGDPAAASPSTTATAAPAAGLTAPGAELRLGSPATLPVELSGTTGTYTVSVDAVERGTDAELADLDLGDAVAGMTPFYVRYTVTGGQNAAALRGTDITQDISALLPDGSEATPVILFQEWDRCAHGDQGVDFAEGSTYQTCRIFVAPSSLEITTAQFSAYDTDYDSYDGEPVTWS